MKSNKDLLQFHTLFDRALVSLNHENINYPCKLIDFSLQGCLLDFKSTWGQHNLDALYTLTLQLPDAATIIMNVSISHVVDNEVSFKCEHIANDDILLLRKFIKLNSASDVLLDRELIALTHYPKNTH